MMASSVGAPKDAGVAGIEHLGGALIEFGTADVETGEHLPAGGEGELIARGPTTMLGFWRKPEESAEAVDGHGWVRSGDLGIVHADGYLELTGYWQPMKL